MIFLSHNSKDKGVVEPIALRLSQIFGIDKVFYDSWSIQPGDGIIDRMNEGLENCNFFFFFISANSLKSEMVKMEWQNILMRNVNKPIRFIPIRLDNSDLPFIIAQLLYIDLASNGIEIALRQMVDVINGQSTFSSRLQSVSNINASLWRENNKIIIEIKALYYMEPITRFVFGTPNDKNDMSCKIRDNMMLKSGFSENALISSDQTLKINAILLDGGDALVPGFPQYYEFSPSRSNPIDIFNVMHEVKLNDWKNIPLVHK